MERVSIGFGALASPESRDMWGRRVVDDLVILLSLDTPLYRVILLALLWSIFRVAEDSRSSPRRPSWPLCPRHCALILPELPLPNLGIDPGMTLRSAQTHRHLIPKCRPLHHLN